MQLHAPEIFTIRIQNSRSVRIPLNLWFQEQGTPDFHFMPHQELFSVPIHACTLSWYLMQPGIIRVQGHATVLKDPDTVILSFTISGQTMKYDHSVRQVNTRVETLRDELEKSPIDRKALKTTNFSITSDSRYDEEEKGRIFLGFVCKHDRRLELPSDKQEPGRIIDHLAVSMSQPEMKISIDVRDKDGLHREGNDRKGRPGRTEQCRDPGEGCRRTTGTDREY